MRFEQAMKRCTVKMPYFYGILFSDARVARMDLREIMEII